MKNMKKRNNSFKNKKFKPGSKKRENKCIVTFDDQERQDFLTGFHKRKVERRKAAVAEIRKKIKEEQSRVREERHKEYLKMLKERTDALDEVDDGDDLEEAVTSTTQSVQYDHPNHTVTVTTISDLDLSGAHLLGPAEDQVNEEDKDEEKKEGEGEQKPAMPRKSGNPIMNKKIRSLMTSLSSFTSKRRKGRQEGRRGRDRPADKRRGVTELKKKSGKSSKWQRRRQTGRKGQHLE